MRLFCFEPEWTRPCQAKLVWKTKVQESLSTREVRYSQSPAAVRALRVHISGLDGGESDALKVFLTRTRDERIVWPYWPHQAELTGLAGPVATVTRGGLFAGRYAIFYRSWEYAEAVKVSSVAGNVLNLESAPVLDWHSGDLVVSGFVGTIKEAPTGSQETDEIFEGDITFIESV